MGRHTDLAMESRDIWAQSHGGSAPEGVRSEKRENRGYSVPAVTVESEEGAAALGKPVGRYLTLELDELFRRAEGAFSRGAEAIAGELAPLLPEGEKAPVLVLGLGNRAVTPDAVGPLTVKRLLVTRHLPREGPFASFRPVSAVAAGVLGETGVESGELARALLGPVKPAAVIAVDALSARAVERVCRTVQLSDAGIVPGSGVGNHRAPLTAETLGVPVIAVGVPTVVDAGTLCEDLLEEAGAEGLDPGVLRGKGRDFFVTPREIDTRVADLAKVVAYGLNLALHPGLSLEELEMLLE